MMRRLALSVVLVVVAAGGAAAQDIGAAAGRIVAERRCGICHSLDAAPSPVTDAPSFVQLYRRYPAGGVRQILKEGMTASAVPREGGSRSPHPRMPAQSLSEDEIAALIDYLQSMEISERR